MARERFCPEITDPELRIFLDMVPDLRKFNTDLIRGQKHSGEEMRIHLPGRDIAVWFHKAKNADGTLITDRACPAVFEFHGGGFVLGNAEKDDALCERITDTVGCHTIGVDYRLAPEHPFPAAVKDAYGIVRKMQACAGTYGIDRNRMAVIGFSGGATLAAAAAMQTVLNGEFSLAGQVLHYPYLDSVRMPDEKQHYDCDMDPVVMRAFTLLYSTEEERGNPYVSPVCASAEELKGTAPALIIPAERDALKDEALVYAGHLQAAGVPTELYVMPDAHHGYIEDHGNPEVYETTPENTRETHSPYFHERAEEALERTCTFLKNCFDGGSRIGPE